MEALADQAIQTEMLRVRPHVGVEPRELICCRSANCRPQEGVCRVENGEHRKELLGLPACVLRRQERQVATTGAADCSDEFDDRLVRHPKRAIYDPFPEQRLRDRLLGCVSRIEPIDEHVRINERGHGPRTAPRGSSRVGRASPGALLSPSRARARAAVRSLRRTGRDDLSWSAYAARARAGSPESFRRRRPRGSRASVTSRCEDSDQRACPGARTARRPGGRLVAPLDPLDGAMADLARHPYTLRATPGPP